MAGMAGVASRAKNGAGSFVLQLHRMTLNYCEHGGSSKQLREFIAQRLPAVAAENPSVLFVVEKRNGKHPYVKADYLNGRNKTIGLKNLSPEEIMRSVDLLRNTTGAKVTHRSRPDVYTENKLAGTWNPFQLRPGSGTAKSTI